MKDTSFYEYIVSDVMKDIPFLTTRRMFGGWALYTRGLVFSLIIRDELYFKTDETFVDDFKRYNSHPFMFEKSGKDITTSYWTLPEEIMENKEQLPSWVERSARLSIKH